MAVNKGYLKIVGTGHYVPDTIITNSDMEQIVDTTDEWITSRTGIKERHVVFDETTSDLAYKATLNVLEKTGYDKHKIDLIIVATFTPDLKSPSVASLVQTKLGLNQMAITAFDINAACTGFIYALNVAEKMLRSNAYKSALVIGAEVISGVVDYCDRNTCVLFGDGAGAMILEKDLKKLAIFNISTKVDNDLILYVDQYVHMDGQRVYQFASRVIESSVREVLAYGKIRKADIRKVIPHQANIRIIQSASKALMIPIENFFVNIHKYGNTSAASIAIAFDEMMETEVIEPGEQIVLVGFGAGLTFGACMLTI